jgi:hypothetical protein
VVHSLEERCSEYFTYGDLIVCGESWGQLSDDERSQALPQEQQTWRGLEVLAQQLLDPLVREFGEIELTYGFAAAVRTRKIRSSICPSVDQHAGAEINRRGALICSRLGQACDLRFHGTDSIRVARWITERLPFDRMYLYGTNRPLHVSIGPETSRAAFAMVSRNGRRLPRALRTPSDWDTITPLLEG